MLAARIERVQRIAGDDVTPPVRAHADARPRHAAADATQHDPLTERMRDRRLTTARHEHRADVDHAATSSMPSSRTGCASAGG